MCLEETHTEYHKRRFSSSVAASEGFRLKDKQHSKKIQNALKGF